ncbi:hypothetical protein C0Q70_19606 [Pomacea canaliculata]|uniref:Uncharacterized protein n=1 Tax=Pomacea canaliculata TaxID=400727 RepID=A0A2T7NJT8_POMCA|nr:hypothetical protein C0Q70_19606 [Pomacea canaliculata]
MSRARGTTDIADVLPSSAVAAHPAARSGVISIHRATSLSSRAQGLAFTTDKTRGASGEREKGRNMWLLSHGEHPNTALTSGTKV